MQAYSPSSLEGSLGDRRISVMADRGQLQRRSFAQNDGRFFAAAQDDLRHTNLRNALVAKVIVRRQGMMTALRMTG